MEIQALESAAKELINKLSKEDAMPVIGGILALIALFSFLNFLDSHFRSSKPASS